MRFTLRSRQRLRHACGQGHYSFFYADAPEGFASERARGLPLREANDTLALLRHAGTPCSAASLAWPYRSFCSRHFCS